MVDLSIYVVTQEIAMRSGVIDTRYRTKDGRFILNSRDLSRIRLVGEEFVRGLEGVESVTKQEADRLIAEGGYKMGLPEENTTEQSNEESVEQPADEQEAVLEEVSSEGNADVASEEETESETNNEEE